MTRTAAFCLVVALLATAQAGAETPSTTPPGDETMAKARAEAYWAMIRRSPPEREIRELLRRGDFIALERKLETLQRHYEAGRLNEYVIYNAFLLFGKADLQPDIERWATERPKAWPALAARGMMHWGAGARVGGGKFISPVSQAQLEQMQTDLDLAASDFHAVLAQRPRFLPAHARLIDIATMLGDDAAGHAAIEAALRQDPNTYLVRETYMLKLTPRWGGSYEAMDAFAREAQAHATVNPQLKDLLGDPWAERGYDRMRAKDWQGTVEMYTRALRFSRGTGWLGKRAAAYKKLQKWREAIADLNEALHYDPDQPNALADRATCFLASNQLDASLRDYARAVELGTDESWIVLDYGGALSIAHRPQDAVPVYERFVAAHPDDAEVLEALGVLYHHTLQQPQRARDVLAHVTQVAPERLSAWRLYGQALAALGDPRAREIFVHYLELVDDAQGSDPQLVAERVLASQMRDWLSPPAPPAALQH